MRFEQILTTKELDRLLNDTDLDYSSETNEITISQLTENFLYVYHYRRERIFLFSKRWILRYRSRNKI